MPKLRRLSGPEVIDILTRFGFEVIRVRGSHHRLRLMREGAAAYLSVPVHGKHPIAIPTLRSIYKQACQDIPEEDLRPYFYADK